MIPILSLQMPSVFGQILQLNLQFIYRLMKVQVLDDESRNGLRHACSRGVGIVKAQGPKPILHFMLCSFQCRASHSFNCLYELQSIVLQTVSSGMCQTVPSVTGYSTLGRTIFGDAMWNGMMFFSKTDLFFNHKRPFESRLTRLQITIKSTGQFMSLMKITQLMS